MGRWRRRVGERSTEVGAGTGRARSPFGASMAGVGGALRRPREGALRRSRDGDDHRRLRLARGRDPALIRNAEDAVVLAPYLGENLGRAGQMGDRRRLRPPASVGARTRSRDGRRAGLRPLDAAHLGVPGQERQGTPGQHRARRGFGGMTQERVREAGHEGVVTFSVAPLRAGRFGATEMDWYDVEKVLSALPDKPIDLLVIDGPPAVTRRRGGRRSRCSTPASRPTP